MEQGHHVVTLFGSSSLTTGSAEEALAFQAGRALADAGFWLCNGGYGGAMEASARGAKEAGGTTIGVVTSFYRHRKPNAWIDRVIEVETMVDRLLKLAAMGDAYVVLRGGTGTLFELAAVWEMMGKGVMPAKPLVIVGEYWKSLIAPIMDELHREGRGPSADLVFSARNPAECVAFLIHQLGVSYEA